ncbi:MAG: hypothetical protein V4544_02185 [Pseudomonadota bacterium]
MQSIAMDVGNILKQWFAVVCMISSMLTLCFELAHSKNCSQKDPRGTCATGKTCLLNGNAYGCYGRCAQSSFGSCSKNEICLVSFIHISKNLKKMPVYACFTCTDNSPLGTCPAGKSCFTCNGSSTCVTDDFVCKKKTVKVVSATNSVSTTTKDASTLVATTTKAK